MIVHILRKRPGGKQYSQDFSYDGVLPATVAYILDTVNYSDDLYDVNGERADRIAWEHSCRQGMCGGCAMVINGVPALACETFVDGNELTLEPLKKFPAVEDLMVDRSIIFDNLKSMGLWLEEANNNSPFDAAMCLKCGLCLEACPNYAEGERFYGPAVLAETYLTLCQGGKCSIKKEYGRHFELGCSKSGACEKVCPRNIKLVDTVARLNRGIK